MSKNELHELMMGAALVALGYALYKHFKAPAVAVVAPSPATIAASDQAAIQTAIGTMPTDAPAITVPAPIAVQGDASTGYSTDTGNWLTNLMQGVL